MNFLWSPWRRMFDFRGRATRREYWALVAIFYVGVTLISVAAEAIAPPGAPVAVGLIAMSVLVLFTCVGMLAWIAAGVRRLHDQDKTGWFLLITLFPIFGWIFHLVMMLTPGTDGGNSYGSNPRDPNAHHGEIADVFA